MASDPGTDSCIFCKIVAGDAPVSTVYEDDRTLVLMTIGPVTPGHAMVIPKEHFAFMNELDEELGAHLFRITQRVAQAIRHSGLECEGINLFLADGKAASQDVFHFHLHVFPRFKGDSFSISADWSNKPPREELDRTAGLLRAAYERLYPNDIKA
jgi:histidine triad (HIT) family protein